ncbi:MAG: HD domain-containing protein [Dorea sp.]|nr:HD domain-containing protein [Dorea sp.]
MIDQAKAFATRAHEGQVRKGTKRPYITHPIEVAEIVSTMTDDPDIISAAYLHDTVEDCNCVSLDLIRSSFGERVAYLVASESEDKSKTWMERKQATIDRLAVSPKEIQMIALADKLSNIRDIYRDYPEEGENLWNRFRMKDKKVIGWYYICIREVLRKSYEGVPAFEEYAELVHHIFEE